MTKHNQPCTLSPHALMLSVTCSRRGPGGPGCRSPALFIDPGACAAQLAARVIEGELDDNMERRFDELRAMSTSLSNRQAILARERQPILDNFEDDIDFRREYQMLGSTVRGWLFTAREWHIARSLELDRDRKAFWKLEDRFARFYNQVRDLKGIDVVCTSLVWNAGYPLAGISPLSRWFDETPNRRAIWLVSAGNTHSQTWTGPYRDVDRNGMMEFAAPQTKLAAGSWTRELNFLAWQPHQAPQVLEIPPGAKVRVTMQWRDRDHPLPGGRVVPTTHRKCSGRHVSDCIAAARSHRENPAGG